MHAVGILNLTIGTLSIFTFMKLSLSTRHCFSVIRNTLCHLVNFCKNKLLFIYLFIYFLKMLATSRNVVGLTVIQQLKLNT